MTAALPSTERPLPVRRWPDPETLEVGGTVLTTNIFRPADDDRLLVLKPPAVVERYLDLIDAERPRRIVELGTKDGGSAALLAAAADPDLVLTVDLAATVPPPLARVAERADLDGRLLVRSGIDQGDRDALVAVLAETGADRDLDLVVDDASHLLGPTRTSFEVLFPRLRPGGLYVIEDWCVDALLADALVGRVPDAERDQRVALVRTLFHRLNDPDFALPDSVAALSGEHAAGADTGNVGGLLGHLLAIGVHADLAVLHDLGEVVGRPLVDLAIELTAVAVGDSGAIADVRADREWLAVRRGTAPLDPDAFRLADLWTDHFGYLA